jgi:hypothetical protein
MPNKLYAVQFEVIEWGYNSSKIYNDPFNEIELDVIIKRSDGETWKVPAFWAGGNEWRVRFAPPEPGKYQCISLCSDVSNTGLHDCKTELEAGSYEGSNPILMNGPLRVAESKRTFEFENGKSLFWLGDTWWMGLCKRLSWPDDFKLLVSDRVNKGFSVIHIVAGLYPDMPEFDERGKNEAGYPWKENYSEINPQYFDLADSRISYLVKSGLMPMIVGCWGYYLPLLGLEKMKKHWRYIIARWGAYPVIWCLAGEATMPFYLSKDKDNDGIFLKKGWTQIAEYVKNLDPFKRLITIHPTQVGRDQVENDSLLDFNMLQTGHGGFDSVPDTLKFVTGEYSRAPKMPVVIGEVSYEGILHGTQAEIQRLTFWSAVLSGAGGFTYGANGIWQVNQNDKPYGPSPHGASWGDTPWEEAYKLPGSYHLSLAKKFLQKFPWPEMQPHPEWTDPIGSDKNPSAPFAAGIPEKFRIIYFYNPSIPWASNMKVLGIEKSITYNAYFWDPRTGKEHQIGKVTPDNSGSWEIPMQPVMSDWVLVMEKI